MKLQKPPMQARVWRWLRIGLVLAVAFPLIAASASAKQESPLAGPQCTKPVMDCVEPADPVGKVCKATEKLEGPSECPPDYKTLGSRLVDRICGSKDSLAADDARVDCNVPGVRGLLGRILQKLAADEA